MDMGDMEAGKVIEDIDAQQILTNPGHRQP